MPNEHGAGGGQDFGIIAANTAHTQQQHEPHAAHTATAGEAGLRESLPSTHLGDAAVKTSAEMQTIGGEAIRLPVGEGVGALSDHQPISLGSYDPAGLPQETPLSEIKGTGDVDLSKGVSPQSNLNAMNDHGVGAIDAVSSAPSHGGGH